MSELTIMHKYGISATYYDNKFEAVQKDDLNKMLDEFNKRNINVHNIYFNVLKFLQYILMTYSHLHFSFLIKKPS